MPSRNYYTNVTGLHQDEKRRECCAVTAASSSAPTRSTNAHPLLDGGARAPGLQLPHHLHGLRRTGGRTTGSSRDGRGPSCVRTAAGLRDQTSPPRCRPRHGLRKAHAYDPDGHCIQLYHYIERIGWDGRRATPLRAPRSHRASGPRRWSRSATPTRTRYSKDRSADMSWVVRQAAHHRPALYGARRII